MSKDIGNNKSCYLHQFKVGFSVSCGLGMKKSPKYRGNWSHAQRVEKKQEYSADT